MVLCDLCKADKAIIKVRYASLNLCRKCLFMFVERKVEAALKSVGVLDKLSGKLVLVAVSGGKDSTNTAYIIHRLSKELDFDVRVLFINEGIGEYSRRREKAVRNFCKNMKIECDVVDMRQEMGINIDEAAQILFKSGVSVKPCSVCGVFRRYIMNRRAIEVGADYVATGHNLDDEVQTFIMSLLRGDIRSIAREVYSIKRTIIEELVPRIKPLFLVYERESAVYSLAHNFNVVRAACPYAPLSMRYIIRKMVNDLEYKRPGTKYRILALKETIGRSIRDKVLKEEEIKKCSKCGMPSSREICRACELKEMLHNLAS
ncbi:MAG: TIGR00269 family protein [Thermoprotei archaeon]|nr:MAG: TIGR00269 family protein [Thermoprotei archaeon]